MIRKFFFPLMLMASTLSATAQGVAKTYKSVSQGNPISPCVFCADPTAIYYDGRIYVYGSNDHQQFIVNGKKGENGYGNIKSLVVLSTDDLANWTFHGTIDVGRVCGSWCGQSWAPSAVWRTTDSGQPEFFIYFSNGGGSVGVIKGSSPIGPFRSPLTKALITGSTPGVSPCNWVFDPGVVIDDEGTAWIAFGGGDPNNKGTKLQPNNACIAKLKPSMTALDGSAVKIPAPYHFEASELNIIGGKMVYTYCTSWSDRNDWSSYSKRGSFSAPSACSMCYMKTDTPLDPNSWEYCGQYLANPGTFGYNYGNNHTHLQKVDNNYYLFYHAMSLEKSMNTGASGFRSIQVNKATVNESAQRISAVTANNQGPTALANLNPYVLQQAETMSTCGGVSYEDFTNITKVPNLNTLGNDASKNLQVKMAAGSWTMLRKVEFGTPGAASLMIRAKGTGKMELRLGSLTNAATATVDIASTAWQDYIVPVDPEAAKGTRNVFFVFTESTNVQFDAWQFGKEDLTAVPSVAPSPSHSSQSYDLSGRPQSASSKGIVLQQSINAQGRAIIRKVLRK